MTEDTLQELLAFWQPKLRVADWQIILRLVSTKEMGDLRTNGTCDPLLEQKVAKINILRPEDHPDDAFLPYDAERTLVHECLHLLAVPCEPKDADGPEYTALEQMLNAVTSALIELKRGDPDRG